MYQDCILILCGTINKTLLSETEAPSCWGESLSFTTPLCLIEIS